MSTDQLRRQITVPNQRVIAQKNLLPANWRASVVDVRRRRNRGNLGVENDGAHAMSACRVA